MSNKPLSDYFYDKAIAVFVKDDDPGNVWAIMSNQFAQVAYVEHFRSGMPDGVMDANRITLDMGGYTCVKSPIGNLYHVWHVCICDKCSHVVHDSAFGDSRIGGRVFDHSQGAWNDHLRYVPNEAAFTYNTLKG